MPHPGRSWPEERKWYDGDTIGPPVGPWAGREDHHVDDVFLDLLLQPEEMLHIGVVNCPAEFHLDGEHPPVGPLHDEVDFPVAAKCSQVPNTSLSCLGVHTDGQCGQRFKESADERALPRLFGLLASQERLGRRPQEPRCERRIGEVVFRRVR